jgi:hypothetical protein
MPALSNENSLFERVSNYEMASTPSSLQIFNINNTISNLSKITRRSRKERLSNNTTIIKDTTKQASEKKKYSVIRNLGQTVVLNNERITNSTAKSIESVTIYKQLPPKFYSVSSSTNLSPVKHLKKKNTENF